MVNQNHGTPHDSKSTLGVLIGLLVGSLAGAVTMLLLAPQSGRNTRKRIQEKGAELRHQTTELVDDTMAQLRSNADKIAVDGRAKVKELKKQGKELAVDQLDRVSTVVKAGRTAVKSA